MDYLPGTSPEITDVWDIFVALGIFLGVVVGVIVMISVITVFTFSKTKLKRLSVPSKKYKKALARGMKQEEWAKAHGFGFVGFYMIGANSNLFMCAWCNDDSSRFFAAYVLPQGKITYDLVTFFEPEGGLTTASTKDGLFLPFPPGSYTQAFSKRSMDQRWQKHLEAEAYLGRELGAMRSSISSDFEQSFLRAIRRQMLYVRSIRGWYIKAVYWYLIRKSKLANKSIEVQHNAGQITLEEPVYDAELT